MDKLRLHYQTIEFGKLDIHLCTLRNTQEFYDPDGTAEMLGISSASWPIFGVIWPSSLVLARFIDSYDINTKRVLEVGCGIGLTSLLLNKKCVDVTATDYHPESQTFLNRNTVLNGDKAIPFELTNWANQSDSLGRFDLIIGSDLLYEDNHIELLANFIDAHAKAQCEVILVDPGRGRKNKLATRMIAFGFSVQLENIEHNGDQEPKYKGYILKFCR